MTFKERFKHMRQARRMLRMGYTPTRWSATGVDLTLATEAWICNGAGCFTTPEEAAGIAPVISNESWEKIYLYKQCLSVSSQGRIKDSNGNELVQVMNEDTKYMQVLVNCIVNGAKAPRYYDVHQLISQGFCSLEPKIGDPSTHHLNGNRYDNRAANLICISKQDHNLIHAPKADERFFRQSATAREICELVSSTPSRYQLSIKQRARDWREIPDYNGLYWINQHGMIIRSDNHSMGGYQEPGRWFINLENVDGVVKRHAIDYLVASTWMETEYKPEGFLDEKKGVLEHINGDLSDSSFDNLQWVAR